MVDPDEDKTKLNQVCCSSVELEAQNIVHKLESWSLDCKASSAIGSMVVGDPSCQLFSNSFKELEERFKSEISSITAKHPKGVSPEFLEKIWSIMSDQATGAVELNSQHNRQSADRMLSRHFSTNDRML